MRGIYNTEVRTSLGIPATTQGRDNADAVHTLAADTNNSWVIFGIDFGYSADPAATKEMTIVYTQGGTATTITFPIQKGDFKSWTPPVPIQGDQGTSIVTTLPASGTGGVKGYLNVHWA